MTTQPHKFPALALVGALFLAMVISPASSALASPPSDRIVLWYDDPFSFGFPDYRSGLAAWFGIDIAAACSGGDPNISLIHIQDLTLPQADQRIIRVANSDALPVTVWRVDNLDEWGCPIGTAAPIASGQVRVRNTDNDVFAFVGDNPNANAWGVTAQGTLTRTTGQRLQFSSVYRNVWDGVDAAKISHFVIRIELHEVP
jgi:hypothetical protein